MALTVQDIITIPQLTGFRLMAGEGGMDRMVTSAGIADYEFAAGLAEPPKVDFEKDSLVITSLLFALEDPGRILPAIQTLQEAGVSAIACKPVVFQGFPEEVLQYADEKDLPLFLFPKNLPFEDIIFQVMDAVHQDDSRHLSEMNITAMIKGGASAEIPARLARKGISLKLQKYTAAAYLRQPDFEPLRYLQAFYHSRHLRDKILLSIYDGGLFLLTTSPRKDGASHRLILTEACQLLGIPADAASCPMSDVHTETEFRQIFREAYHAWLAGTATGSRFLHYSDIGIFHFLIPLADTPELIEFSDNYIDALSGYEDTIEAYTKNGGDTGAAAVDLQIHNNTMRYRIARMKTLAGDPDQTDQQFFRDLFIAAAVRRLHRRETI